MEKNNKLPVIFVDHWSPMRIIQDNIMNEKLEKLWDKLSNKVKWILVISAHYETYWNSITIWKKLKTIHDFYWFPEQLYSMNYDVETDDNLINLLKEKLSWDIILDDKYWIDHWAWTVLKKMFPKADKKVVLLSVNHSLANKWIFEIWNKIKYLRDEWYLIIWSWNILHNFSEIDFYNENSVSDWALELNNLIKNKLINKEYDDLINFENLKNSFKAFKTFEHYKPLIYILWMLDEDDKAEYINEQITNSSLSNNLILFSN